MISTIVSVSSCMRRRLSGVVLAALMFSAVMSAVEWAAAQPTDAALADSLFQQARELMKEEKWAQACPKLAESQRLDPKLGTLLNLAVCHEREGKIATAHSEFRSLQTLASREGQQKRADFAKERMAALGEKLSHLVIAVASPAGVTVSLDGKEMTAAAFGVPLALDPGKHEIVAKAAGKKPWTKTVEVPPEKSEIRVEVPELEDEAASPPAPEPVKPAPVKPEPVKPEPVPPPEEGGTDLMWLAWTGFAVGGAGLIAGAITGGISLADSSEILDQCDGDACPRRLEDDISGAETLANVSNVAFAVGALGAAVGIVAVLVSTGADEATEGARLEFRVTPIGAQLRGRF